MSTSYDILFLSRIIPSSIASEVEGKMIHSLEAAAIVWQMNLIEGIEAHNDSPLSMLNFLPVNSYPHSYRDAFIPRVEFAHTAHARDISLGHCNIRYLKRFFQWPSLRRELTAWIDRKSERQKVLIAYSMYPEFMRAMQLVKKKNPSIITINVVVDLPQYTDLTNHHSTLIKRVFSAYTKRLAYDNTDFVDGFVPITEQMGKHLAGNKAYRVVEGISTSVFPEPSDEPHLKKTILYAGMLYKRFGIDLLLDAFSLIPDPDFELVLCGIGELEDDIRIKAQQDPRIAFKGKLSRDEVLHCLVNANVIVNPRLNVEEYTKFSFPSKNIEALSSGVPFVGYKLDGIPDEYDAYINYPSAETPTALAELLHDVCNDPKGIYQEKALAARDWVLHNKNCVSQGKKVIDLVESILKRE